MAARPLVSVYSVTDSSSDPTVTASVAMPAVFTAPIRTDIVAHVHRDMSKNTRQAYAVSKKAGHQTSAESWGTGRAVSRIPRVPGGGTHRAGQGAFGNMCRGGRMFAPTKVWRKWHRHVNVAQKRTAVVAALAASAVPALVMARGHRIEQVPELPLVLDNDLDTTQKTAKAVSLLKAVGAGEDLDRSKDSKKVRRGKGKMRNRRYTLRKGPLVVYAKDDGVVKAFRNIPGVETASVERLNLLQLAPGGHLGRFIVYSQGAFERLATLYGTPSKPSEKKNYSLPYPMMSNPNVQRLINSDEVQSVLNDPKLPNALVMRKTNAIKNKSEMARITPYSKVLRTAAQKLAKKPKTKTPKNLKAKVFEEE